MDTPSNENQAVIDLVTKLDGFALEKVEDPRILDSGLDFPFAVVPTGKQLVSLKKFIDEYQTKPERRSGIATLTTEESFAGHMNRFSNEESVVFADSDRTHPSLLAVYDYNPQGPKVENAAFGKHRALYQFPVSEAWETWRDKDGVEMGMAEFGHFIEDRLGDVLAVDMSVEPDDSPLRAVATLFSGTYASPSGLLALSRSLEINAAVTVRQALRLDSGEINIQFVEQHSDNEGKPINIANLFVIGIPVFDGGEKYRVVCRLRYRRTPGGSVTWHYNIHRADVYLDEAISDAVLRVGKATGRPVLFGAPEK